VTVASLGERLPAVRGSVSSTWTLVFGKVCKEVGIEHVIVASYPAATIRNLSSCKDPSLLKNQ
jgi:hypothetical protein